MNRSRRSRLALPLLGLTANGVSALAYRARCACGFCAAGGRDVEAHLQALAWNLDRAHGDPRDLREGELQPDLFQHVSLSNQVYGVDGGLRLSNADTIRFQALGSSTEYPGEIAESLDQIRLQKRQQDIAASEQQRAGYRQPGAGGDDVLRFAPDHPHSGGAATRPVRALSRARRAHGMHDAELRCGPSRCCPGL